MFKRRVAAAADAALPYPWATEFLRSRIGIGVQGVGEESYLEVRSEELHTFESGTAKSEVTEDLSLDKANTDNMTREVTQEDEADSSVEDEVDLKADFEPDEPDDEIEYEEDEEEEGITLWDAYDWDQVTCSVPSSLIFNGSLALVISFYVVTYAESPKVF
jgi:hypothetical protein